MYLFTMPDWSQAKAYQIQCDVDLRIYVGLTTLSLEKRLTQHKCAPRPFGQIMREIGVEHFHIYLLEARECGSKEEARQLEQEWIEELSVLDPSFGFNSNAAVSQITPTERAAQWTNEHREHSLERMRKSSKKRREKELARDPEAFRAKQAKKQANYRRRKAERAQAQAGAIGVS